VKIKWFEQKYEIYTDWTWWRVGYDWDPHIPGDYHHYRWMLHIGPLKIARYWEDSPLFDDD
jgi:hypothetical protein